MGSLAEAGVVTAFFGMNGRFLARVEGPVSGNVLLRREQYRVMDDGPACTRIARGIVVAKALNQRGVLQRAVRDHGPALADSAREALSTAIDRMQDIARRALHEIDLDRLRGHEARRLPSISASSVTRCGCQTLRSPSRRAAVGRRWTRRTPSCPLSTPSSSMIAEVRWKASVWTHQQAFLHRLRPGRPSLALDLMEELRAPIADRLALSMLNRRELGPGDFRVMENGAVLLTEESRKTVLTAWQERKREEIEHPFLKERAPIGLLPHFAGQPSGPHTARRSRRLSSACLEVVRARSGQL